MNMVKGLTICLALVLGVVGLTAQNPEGQWAAVAGGLNSEKSHDIATDSQGNQYITGCFQGTATFGPYTLISSGENDIFAAKLDPTGNWLWAVRAGGISNDYSYGIAIDWEGNAYLTGYFQASAGFGSDTLTSSGYNDIFIAKLAPAGNWLWAIRSGGTGNDSGRGITVDDEGNAYLTGFFQSSVGFGPYTLTSSGGFDIFIAKLGPNGNWLWAFWAGGTGDNFGLSIAIDNQGNTYLTGEFNYTATFGAYTITASGEWDVFAAKLDPAGNWLWAAKAGGTSFDAGNSVSVDGSGNAYLTGYFYGIATFGAHTLISNGEGDIFTAKLGEAGNWLWAVSAGVVGYSDIGQGIAVDGAGNAYLTGYFWDTATFGVHTIASCGENDIFIAKLDPDGYWLWVVSAGGEYWEEGLGITVDAADNAFLTGHFSGAVSFGATTHISNGDHDIFVAKLSFQAARPKPPENLYLSRLGNDILLSWDAVNLDTNNQSLIPDAYLVYSSTDADPDTFNFLGEVVCNSYTHIGALTDYIEHFYRVVAVQN